MSRLARSVAELQQRYDAVVVGSGYGGGVAASRLARAGLKVAVLERGREFLPGEFPTSLLGTQRELQVSLAGKRIGSPTALFDMRMGPDVHMMVGCGLGGTSLINANVCLAPDVLAMEDARWPTAVRADHYLNIGYGRARAMLAPEPLPETNNPLKLQALAKAAAALGRDVERVPLHIAFEDKVNAAGVHQPACTMCGDCMGGCNVGAKTTVHATYLADAARHGAEIFTGVRVRFVESVDDGLWRAQFQLGDDGGKAVPVRSVLAPIMILAAGTLGSNEILMRSRARGLKVSDRLGKGVSTNADAIAFGYNNDVPVGAVGVGHPARKGVPPPGPGVAGLIDLRRRQRPEDRIAIVEASVQSAMAAVLPLMLPAGGLMGSDTDRGLKDRVAEMMRTAESLVAGAYTGATRNTQVFLAVGRDSASGEITLDGEALAIRWKDALAEPVFRSIETTLKAAVAATGGTYVPNPVSLNFLGGNLFTVHPLGGCAMGEDRTSGVVDHKCRVFDGNAAQPANAVHAGLYVCDGAVIPCPLGVHPLLTITAVAERAMLLLARELDRPLDVENRNTTPAMEFQERQPARKRPAGLLARLGLGSR